MAHRRGTSQTHARWGGIVGRGSVVKGSFGKGIVLRLLPLDDYSRAYGRQAIVAFYESDGEVYEREVGIGDMTVVGQAKHVPSTHMVEIPPDASAVARHERSRDIRREGQGAYYDPSAPHNLSYEKPLRGHLVKKVKRKSHRRRRG